MLFASATSLENSRYCFIIIFLHITFKLFIIKVLTYGIICFNRFKELTMPDLIISWSEVIEPTINHCTSKGVTSSSRIDKMLCWRNRYDVFCMTLKISGSRPFVMMTLDTPSSTHFLQHVACQKYCELTY